MTSPRVTTADGSYPLPCPVSKREGLDGEPERPFPLLLVSRQQAELALDRLATEDALPAIVDLWKVARVGELAPGKGPLVQSRRRNPGNALHARRDVPTRPIGPQIHDDALRVLDEGTKEGLRVPNALEQPHTP